jgi:hypothetical protein
MFDYFIAAPNGAIVMSGRCQTEKCRQLQFVPDGHKLYEGTADYNMQYLLTGELKTLTPEQMEIYHGERGRQSDFDFDTFTYPPRQVPPLSLADAKQVKWNTIKEKRASMEVAPIEVNGELYDADMISQQRILSAVQLANLPESAARFSVSWTLANNKTLSLSARDLLNLNSAIAGRTAALFIYSQNLRQKIEHAASVAEVDVVQWEL